MTTTHHTVRVLVAQVEGSAPREAGAVMRVAADNLTGTIGGGALEHAAVATARGLLARDDQGPWYRELRTYPLGPALGQCCGGMVRLLFEVENRCPHEGENDGSALSSGHGLIVRQMSSGVPSVAVHDRTHAANWPLPVVRAVRQMLAGERPRQTLLIAGGKGVPAFSIEPLARPPHQLFLYGAGHVGRAVVRVLLDLPFAITWVDTDTDRFPAEVPTHAKPLIATDPAAAAATAPPDALHLIMTFSHALDLAIAAAVLARPHAWAGLIGSATKRARFEKRLREAGVAEAAISGLNCPIGFGAITGKEPAMIAVSVAAQLAVFASAERAVATDSANAQV